MINCSKVEFEKEEWAIFKQEDFNIYTHEWEFQWLKELACGLWSEFCIILYLKVNQLIINKVLKAGTEYTHPIS